MKAFSNPTLILLIAVFSILQVSCSKSPTDHSNEAVELEIKGDIDGAIEEISKSIAVRSDNVTEKEENNGEKLVQDLQFRCNLYLKKEDYVKAYDDAVQAHFWSYNRDSEKKLVYKCESLIEQHLPDYFKSHPKESEQESFHIRYNH